MHQQRVDAGLIMGQRPVAQPVDQFTCVAGSEYRCEVLAGNRYITPQCERQQMQVVIAEYRYCHLAEIVDQAQYSECIGAAIDQVSDKPELVGGGIEREFVYEPPEFATATLDIVPSFRN